MEITLTALNAAIANQYAEVAHTYALDTAARTFKTTESDGGEQGWTYSVDEAGRLNEVTPISYWEFCELNGEEPDFG